MRITALERPPGRKQIQVHFDEGQAMSLEAEVCLRFDLRVGRELSAEQLDAILGAEAQRRCLESALRLLAYRQRTEAELRERLLKKRVASQVVTETIERLRTAGLLDDAQFARNWVEGRNERAPRSRRLIAQELRARGIARTVVERETATVDESEAAYRAAERRARALSQSSYADFRQRVGGLLLRRGFAYDLVRETINRLWQEREEKRRSR
jgi:regulatory protein